MGSIHMIGFQRTSTGDLGRAIRDMKFTLAGETRVVWNGVVVSVLYWRSDTGFR